MAEQSRNLWPTIEQKVIRAPITILREQANYLGQQTSNIILGEVKSQQEAQYGLVHYFYLVAPALGKYRYLLMRVAHSTTSMYPLFIFFDAKFDQRGSLGETDKSDSTEQYIDATVIKMRSGQNALEAKNEDVFEERLANIFSDELTQNILRSLIAQSQMV
jgi:hypothetical protein